MVKYDYSLDVGQSMETDEKIKQKEQEEPQGCCTTPEEPLEIGDEKEDSQEQKEEKLEPEAPDSQNEVSQKVEIKPISFEKAKLLSDFEGEKKEEQENPKEQIKQEKEEKKKDLKETEKPKQEEDKPAKENLKKTEEQRQEDDEPEEDEKDVNEFLEDSFSKEAKNYEIYNNKPKEETIPKKRSWKLPAAIIIILFFIGFFGYFYITAEHTPTGTVTAAPEIELQEPPMIVPNITEPANITEEPEIKNIPEESELNKQNVSDALEMLSIALKDQ